MSGEAAHRPVLLAEALRLLRPAGRAVLVDCTIGPGGHAEALLEAAGGEAGLIGIDRDEACLSLARDRLQRFGGRVRLFQANFADVPDVLAEAGVARADCLLADLGVSSSQLDDPRRGLAFSLDGPLDMRLDRREGPTAAQLLSRLGEAELADTIFAYGEERYSRRIARAIVAARKCRPIERTGELADIVASALPASARRTRRGVHPATRTFQALRLAVNDELGSLQRLLERLPDVLAAHATAAVISFHSLEDRRVKNAFRSWAEAGGAKVLTRKPVTASAEEVADNPRSRSAKLRAIEIIE